MKSLFFSAVLLLSVISLSAQTNLVTTASIVDGEGRILPASRDCSTGYGVCELAVPTGAVANVSDKAPAASGIRGGQRFDVTQYGAVGNGSTDDTAAIQAAFNACWNNGSGQGGTVLFPGNHTYLISGTINAYDTCRIEGSGAAAATSPSQSPVRINWNGPATGTVYNLNSFTVAANSPAIYTPSSPSPAGYPYIVTFPVANSLSVGNWVILQGFTIDGIVLNRTITQIAAATGSSFTVTLPYTPYARYSARPLNGTYTDGGTATTTSVMFAFDANARYQQEVDNLYITGQHGIAADQYWGTAFLLPRVDVGTRFLNTWVEGGVYFGYDFSGGGINVEMDHGFRADSAGMAAVYWRVSGQDNFKFMNGTLNLNYTGSGASVMVDASNCSGSLSTLNGTLDHLDMESDTYNIASGYGIITVEDCPNAFNLTPIRLNLDNVVESASDSQDNPGILVNPPNDLALNLSIVNSQLNGNSAAVRFTGIPSLQMNDLGGNTGIISSLNYSPSLNSINIGLNAFSNPKAPAQFIGDVNISQLWQYKTKASAFLYSDTAFAALPNGTTLFAGQILAPPSYWSGTNGKRYAIDVVYTTGTTGIPNGGATTCSTTSKGKLPNGSDGLTCSSAVSLAAGQVIMATGGNKIRINFIDARNPSRVLVYTEHNPGDSLINVALNFVAPVLGPEIQLPTKSVSAPATLTWSQGDFEQNSKATANGVAAWVNVAAGKPGTWAGIPLGNSSGQITASQIYGTTGSGDVVLAKSPTVSSLTDTGITSLNDVIIRGTCSGCSGRSMRTAQAFCTGTATSSSTLTMFGAGSATASCTSSVGAESVAQVLMTTSGSLSSLAVRCAHTGTNSSSGVFSILDLPSGTALSGAKSGVNTGLTVTYGMVKANTTLFDTTHTFAYARGDLLRIQFTTQANETLGNCEASFNY